MPKTPLTAAETKLLAYVCSEERKVVVPWLRRLADLADKAGQHPLGGGVNDLDLMGQVGLTPEEAKEVVGSLGEFSKDCWVGDYAILRHLADRLGQG
jgi:hypothetical protein